MSEIKIGKKTYALLDPGMMKRSDAKRLAAVMGRIQGNVNDPANLDAAWEILSVMAPTVPDAVLDELTANEVADLLNQSGLLADNGEGVSLGE